MATKLIRVAGTIGMLSVILLVAWVLGCSRSEPPQPGQTSAPATQQAQPPAASAPVAQPPAPTAAPPSSAPSPPAAVQPPTAGPQNFGMLQVGMTSAQIRQLMGEPSRIKQEGGMVEWEYYTPQGKFEVKLANDRIVTMHQD